MKETINYILIPLLFPLLFFLVASTPVEVLGCLTRGLIAVSISLISVLSGLILAIFGLKQRIKRQQSSSWWMISSLILSIPAIYIVFISF
jgi:hypothetical protein